MLTRARFTVVPDASQFVISGRSTLHPIESASRKLQGYLDAAWDDAGGLALDSVPALHVEVPVASLASGNALEDTKLRELVGSRSFPNIVADLQELRPLEAPDAYAVKGSVAVRGTTRVLDGEITAKREGDRVVIDGRLALDMRKFGIEPPRLFMVRVYPEVTVRLHLVAAPA
jgi:polyisoprenoid-binding protein YceI